MSFKSSSPALDVADAASDRSNKPPSDKTIALLVERFAIPEAERELFMQLVNGIWREAWRIKGINHDLPRSGRIADVLERAKSGNAETALLVLRDEKPNAEAAACLVSIVVGSDIGDWIPNASSEARHDALESAKALARKHFRARGRTPGTSGNPAFDLFVQELYHSIVMCRGDPGTGSKKGADPVIGTFFDVLVDLKASKELPLELFPAQENARLAAFKKAAKQAGR